MSAAGGLGAVLERLPHGEPFRFISELTRLEPGEQGAAVWRLGGGEDFFRGHFRGDPVVPGVLLAEALAQLAGLVVFGDAGTDPGRGEGRARAARLAHVDVKFPSAVRPPAEVVLGARHLRSLGLLRLVEVRAECGGGVVASGVLTLAAFEEDNA